MLTLRKKECIIYDSVFVRDKIRSVFRAIKDFPTAVFPSILVGRYARGGRNAHSAVRIAFIGRTVLHPHFGRCMCTLRSNWAFYAQLRAFIGFSALKPLFLCTKKYKLTYERTGAIWQKTKTSSKTA